MPFILFPRYSFVQDGSLSAESCYPDPSMCLPISTPANLAFEATGIGSTLSDRFYPHTASMYFIAVAPDEPCRTDTQTSGVFTPYWPFIQNSSGLFDGGFSGTLSDAVGGVFNDNNGNDTFDDYNAPHVSIVTGPSGFPIPINHITYQIAVGQCFKLQCILDIYSNGSIIKRFFFGCTNCFIRIAENGCYTSLLQYRNDSNAFDFGYLSLDQNNNNLLGGFYNSVELPMYLRDPIMNDDSKVYTRSDGSIVKLYERKEEQYTLETDLMPYTWLKALDVALSHDTVTISNPNAAAFDSVNTARSFQKKENFDIEYQKGPLTAFGKGTCKLLNANPVHLYNNNCS